MAADNATTLGTINTAWKGRTGAVHPALSVLTDQTQLTLTASGDGTTKKFEVAHSLSKRPVVVVMEPQDEVSQASHTVTADATKVYVTFKTAPAEGVDNINFTGVAMY